MSLPPGPNAVGLHEPVAHFMVPDDPVQYAFPLAATAIAIGCFWLVASGVEGFWTRFFIGLVFIVSVTLNTAIEDPDKVPLLKQLRSRARN